jgi:hypothetical protein
MKTVKDAADDLSEDDGIYSLLLTGDQARATLRALAAAPAEDVDAAAARSRLARLLEHRAPAPEVARSDRGEERPSPPYELPDAGALLAFQKPSRRRGR